MLTILAATAIGLYLGNRIHVCFHPEEAFFSFAAPALPTDIRRFYASICFVCAFALEIGRKTRTFVDSVALPWFALVGLHLPELPTLPATSQDGITQPIKRQAA